MSSKWLHSNRGTAGSSIPDDPSHSPTAEVLAQTDRYVIAGWRQLLMLIWSGEANAAGVEHSRRVFEEWVKGHPRGAAFLVVVSARHAVPPDEATREAMRQTSEAPPSSLRGMGTLIQAEGFIAASVRSVIMRLDVLTGKGAPNVFETPAKAAEWATRILGDSQISGPGLTRAIRSAQSRVGISRMTNASG